MGSKKVRWIAFACLSTAVVVSIGVFIAFQMRLTPLKVLYRAVKAHSSSSMHMEGQVTIEPLLKTPISISVSMEHPNKLRGKMSLKKAGAPALLVVSDGKRLWTFAEQWKQCQVEDAPKDMAGTWGSFKPVGPRKDHRENMAVALFCGYKPETEIKEAKLAGTTDVGDKKCYVLSLKYNDGLEQQICVGMRDWLVWQTKTKAHIDVPPLPPIEILITSTCSSIERNPKFGADEFVFKPPKGTKMVESLSLPHEGTSK
jgi:outer membrane lipoprotein-sorting protein